MARFDTPANEVNREYPTAPSRRFSPIPRATVSYATDRHNNPPSAPESRTGCETELFCGTPTLEAHVVGDSLGPRGTTESSSAFQRRVPGKVIKSPGGTAEIDRPQHKFVRQCDSGFGLNVPTSAVPPDLHDHKADSALKRRAILIGPSRAVLWRLALPGASFPRERIPAAAGDSVRQKNSVSHPPAYLRQKADCFGRRREYHESANGIRHANWRHARSSFSNRPSR